MISITVLLDIGRQIDLIACVSPWGTPSLTRYLIFFYLHPRQQHAAAVVPFPTQIQPPTGIPVKQKPWPWYILRPASRSSSFFSFLIKARARTPTPPTIPRCINFRFSGAMYPHAHEHSDGFNHGIPFISITTSTTLPTGDFPYDAIHGRI
jgi:hypothetical protein